MTSPIKKYALFCFGAYDACGGPRDYVDSFDTLEEAKAAALKVDLRDFSSPCFSIWNLEDGRIIETGECPRMVWQDMNSPYVIVWRF